MNEKQLANIKEGDKVWNRNSIKMMGLIIPKMNTFEITRNKTTGELGAKFFGGAMRNPVFFPLEKYHEWFIVPVTH